MRKPKQDSLKKFLPPRPIQTDHYGAVTTINNGYYDDRGEKAHAITYYDEVYHKVAGGMHRESHSEVHFYLQRKTGRVLMVMEKEIYSVQPNKPYLYCFSYQADINKETKTVNLRG